MKNLKNTAMVLALAGTMAMPTVLLAADAAQDEHASHHPAQAAEPAAAPATQERAQAMRERMKQIRVTKDTEKRKQLIEAQMMDMEAMMKDGSCPRMAEGKPGMGMMAGKGGMGMMGGKCGMGMMGGKGGMGMMGQGMSGQDGMMAKRMEMMEMRMDLMQMQMQMQQMQMRMGSGMGPGMPAK